MDNRLILALTIVAFGFLFGTVMYLRKVRNETLETEVITSEDDPTLKSVAEYRTYIVNYFISLLNLWLEEEGAVSCYTTAPNQNLVSYLLDNMVIDALFVWEEEKVYVKVGHFSDSEGYKNKSFVLRLVNKTLPIGKLHKKIIAAVDEHDRLNFLTKDDVLNAAVQISNMPKMTAEEEKDKRFGSVLELMVMMKSKKYRNNKKLLKFYGRFIEAFLRGHREEFLEWLSKEEEKEEKEK